VKTNRKKKIAYILIPIKDNFTTAAPLGPYEDTELALQLLFEDE
jgi:hypothetical protein